MLRWAFGNAGVDGSSHGIRFKTKSKVKAVGHTGLFASGYHAETDGSWPTAYGKITVTPD